MKNDKQFILEFCDDCYSGLHRVDCSQLSTDNCKMLRLYIAENPESYIFGKMYGIFEYQNELYKFKWHIHEPNQKFSSLSNHMTNFEKMISKYDKKHDFRYVMCQPSYDGHKAFWLHTPDDILDGFDLHLRKLMRNLKTYAVSEQLCKKIRKFDKKHLKWRNEINRKLKYGTGDDHEIGGAEGEHV